MYRECQLANQQSRMTVPPGSHSDTIQREAETPDTRKQSMFLKANVRNVIIQGLIKGLEHLQSKIAYQSVITEFPLRWEITACVDYRYTLMFTDISQIWIKRCAWQMYVIPHSDFLHRTSMWDLLFSWMASVEGASSTRTNWLSPQNIVWWHFILLLFWCWLLN